MVCSFDSVHSVDSCTLPETKKPPPEKWCLADQPFLLGFSGASFHHDIVMLFSFQKNGGIKLLHPQIP